MTVCGRIRLRVLACVALALGVTPFAAVGEAKAAESHALAMHGAPALPPGFTHMPYANPDAPKGGRLVEGILGTFDSLNPLIVRGVAVQQVRGLPFERGLVLESLLVRSNDEPFTLYGLLAKSVETDDDRSYVTFHLDPKGRFSDGQPVLADDVLFSWALLRDKGRPNHRQYYSKVAKAEALDPLTVRFDFGGVPDRELPLILGLMPILPRHAINVATFEETSMTAPMGSGPYRVAAVRPGASVTFVRNPDYWGRDLPVNRGLWNFDEVRLEYYREANGEFEAFKRSLYDFRVETEPLRWHEGYDFAAARNGEVIRETARISMPQPSQFLVFNTRRPIFFRYPGTSGPDAAVRFRVDQSKLLFRALCALGGLLRGVRTVRLCAPRQRSRARAFEAVRRAHPAGYSRRQLPPARHRRIGTRSHDAAQRAQIAVGSRLRA